MYVLSLFLTRSFFYLVCGGKIEANCIYEYSTMKLHHYTRQL